MTAVQPPTSVGVVRRRWLVTGRVQGVGFRPFVYHLARQLALSGWVRNDSSGVTIEAQGALGALDQFDKALSDRAPPAARVDRITSADVPSREGESDFHIAASAPTAAPAPRKVGEVSIDTAVCADCLAELLSPSDRRRGYGLINCTQCGPRYTIVRRVPYDRCNTTMASFAMCDPCRREYEAPADRRFHAQPIACHDCGPKVSYAQADGSPVRGDPYSLAADALLSGKILAIKGLGGYHLAVRADDERAVGRLRKLKHRDRKPLALMCRNLAEVERLVDIGPAGRALLQSPATPILIAPRRAGAAIADSVAPRNHRLGVMLPYTPIQHLLFHTRSKLGALVMTSANGCDEPLVIDDQEAIDRLGGICDGILRHDRPIERGVDDSVIIDMRDDDPLPIRRARGFVPAAIELPVRCEADGICVGGELKTTVAAVRGGEAILSQHIGDLTHPRTYHVFRKTIEDLQQLFRIRPKWIAHDLHPMYLSTMQAKQMAAASAALVPVQHHHAHAAAVMAEHHVREPVLAMVCDGTGYGTDGSIWGGELLVADLLSFRRVARLHPLRLAGGDAAARDPRRCALALLFHCFGPEFQRHPLAKMLFPVDREREVLCHMIADSVSCTLSSGAGRYLDAVAALLGICLENTFEAEAAMALEAQAAQAAPPAWAGKAFELRAGKPAEIDLAPLVRELLRLARERVPAAQLAALFHEKFAAAWDELIALASAKTGLRTVALSGGVFCNAILTRRLTSSLERRGLRVLRHRIVPPNDGGLALGQAAIASARFAAGLIRKDGA